MIFVVVAVADFVTVTAAATADVATCWWWWQWWRIICSAGRFNMHVNLNCWWYSEKLLNGLAFNRFFIEIPTTTKRKINERKKKNCVKIKTTRIFVCQLNNFLPISACWTFAVQFAGHVDWNTVYHVSITTAAAAADAAAIAITCTVGHRSHIEFHRKFWHRWWWWFVFDDVVQHFWLLLRRFWSIVFACWRIACIWPIKSIAWCVEQWSPLIRIIAEFECAGNSLKWRCQWCHFVLDIVFFVLQLFFFSSELSFSAIRTAACLISVKINIPMTFFLFWIWLFAILNRIQFKLFFFSLVLNIWKSITWFFFLGQTTKKIFS